jgi:quinol monooxygenase YgiN
MVRLSVALVASARSAPRLLQALQSLLIAQRLKPGCIGCSAWTDRDHTVHYEEHWATEAAMEDRVRSDEFTLLLAVVEASEAPPRVEFDFVTKTRGLDYVAEIRRASVPADWTDDAG